MKESNQENSTRIAKNTLFLFFRLLLVVVVGFFTSRVILQTLGVEDYGIYNIVGSIVISLSFFKNALTNATYRFFTYELGRGDQDLLKKIFSMSLNVHCILAIGLFLIMEFVGIWFLNNKLNIPIERLFAANCVFQLSLFTFCIEIIKTPYNSCIIAHERMDFYALTSIAEVFFKLLVVYMLLLFDYDKLIIYALLVVFISGIMFVWYVIYCLRKFQESHVSYYWNKKIFRQLLSYSGWSILVNAADVSVVQCINVFLNLFSGVVANAAMGIANQVNSILNNFLGTFTNSFNPQIIKSYAKSDLDYFMKLLFSTSRLSFYLLFAVSFPVMLNIDYLLRIWLINPPELSSIFLCLIACYSLIDAFSAPLWNAVHATGKLKTHQLLMSSIKIINIPLSYYFLNHGFPVYVPLVVFVVLNIVCALTRIIYLKSLIQLPVIKYFREVLLRILFVVIITIPLPLYCMHSNCSDLNKLFISTISFLLLYLMIIYWYGIDKNERLIINNIYIKYKHKFSKRI